MTRNQALAIHLLIVIAIFAIVSASGCRRKETPSTPPAKVGAIQLRDVTQTSGIKFHHTDGSSGRRYIIEPMCAGMATFDYDNDGLIDVYFLNGAPLPGTELDYVPKNRLFRNLGDFQFVDVTEASGAGDEGYGLGVTAGDYDNDGDQDLYLNNGGPDVLLRNNGDGTFSSVTPEVGIDNGDLVGAGAAFLDIEGDGDLDLYAANYLDFHAKEHTPRWDDGFPSYPSPHDFKGIPDRLFRNNGDGTFTDISDESGISAVDGHGMGMVCADVDNDGDTDIFVLNDVEVNYFFRNDGTGKFEECSILAGLGYNAYGQENASMGVDCADINCDGWLDFFMTAYQGEFPVLYRNLGEGRFEDATQETGAGEGSYNHVNWGTGLVDFDQDADVDLFIAHGHTEDNIELRDNSTAYKLPNQLLKNTDTGNFVDATDESGDGLDPVRSSRGTAFDDLDNDGDIDGVVLNAREEPTVLRNEAPKPGHWIQFHLIGVQASRDGVGAHVLVTTGDRTQLREVHSGRGYQSHHGTNLHFGLGDHDHVDRVEVRWLGGHVDIYENVPADKLYQVMEGSSALIP